MWTYPISFSQLLVSFFYSFGVKNAQYNADQYMLMPKADYINNSCMNIFATNLGKGLETVQGFVTAFGI